MIVIDASVANKFILPGEEGYALVQEIFQKHGEGTEEIIVPELLFYEVANTLATKSEIPSSQIDESLDTLFVYSLRVQQYTSSSIKKAAHFAKQHKVSVYDAIYAVLAEEKQCDLITADAKFVQQVKLPFVKLLK